MMIELCIFCETGIRQSLYFILSVMGLGMLGVVALFLWSWARGQYKNVEAPKFKMLELELIQKSKIKNQSDKPKTKNKKKTKIKF